MPCDRAGALDALQQSSKHQAEFVFSNAVPPSRDVVAEDSEEKPSPDIAPEGDGVSLENDQVKTSFRHVGLIIEVCAGSAMLSRCFSACGFDVMPIDHSFSEPFSPFGQNLQSFAD